MFSPYYIDIFFDIFFDIFSIFFLNPNTAILTKNTKCINIIDVLRIGGNVASTRFQGIREGTL